MSAALRGHTAPSVAALHGAGALRGGGGDAAPDLGQDRPQGAARAADARDRNGSRWRIRFPETRPRRPCSRRWATLFPGQPLRRDGGLLRRSRRAFAARGAAGLVHCARMRALPDVTVHDIYCERTLGALPRAHEEVPSAAEAAAPGNRRQRPACAACCAAWRRRYAAAAGLPEHGAMAVALLHLPLFTGDQGDSMPRAILASLLVFLLANLGSFALRHRRQLVLVRASSRGAYPLWGMMYFRWWLADRISEDAAAPPAVRLVAQCAVPARAGREDRRGRDHRRADHPGARSAQRSATASAIGAR